MIDSLIAKYLTGNKRLVVPGFGAFIRKDEGDVVFMEFLKKDDSVLTGLVSGSLGIGEEEARAVVAEFADWVRALISETGECALEGIGVMRRAGGGLYELRYNPSVRRDETPAEPETTASSGAAPTSVADPGAEAEQQESIPENVIVIERRDEPDPQPERMAASEPNSRARWENMMESPAEEKRPEPVKDSRDWYGVPMESRENEEDEANEARGEPDREPSRQRPQQQRRRDVPGPPHYGVRRKRADIVMIIAILAALIAVGSIIFGIMTQNDPVDMIQPTNPQQTETPAAPQTLEEAVEETL